MTLLQYDLLIKKKAERIEVMVISMLITAHQGISIAMLDAYLYTDMTEY